jgi:hypothetical protein
MSLIIATSAKSSKDAGSPSIQSSRQLLGDHPHHNYIPADNGLSPSAGVDNLQGLSPDAALAAFRAHQARLLANSAAPSSGSGPRQLHTFSNASGATVHRTPEPPLSTPYPPTAPSQSGHTYSSNNDPQSHSHVAYTSTSDLSLSSSVVPAASGAFPPLRHPNHQQTYSPSSGVRRLDPTFPPYPESLTTDFVSPATVDSGSDTGFPPLQPLRYVESEPPTEPPTIDPKPVPRWKSFRRK